MQDHRKQRTMDDKELFDLVRESYASANADYISEQIRMASAHILIWEPEQEPAEKNWAEGTTI